MTSSGGIGAQTTPAEQATQPTAESGPIYEPNPDKGKGSRHSVEVFGGAMLGAVALSNADKVFAAAGQVASNIAAMGAGSGAVEAGAAAVTGLAGGADILGAGIETALSANGLGLGLKSLEGGAGAVLSLLANTGKFAVEGAVSIALNPMVLTTLALYGAYVYRDKLAALAKKVVKFPKGMWTKVIKSEVGKGSTPERNTPVTLLNGALPALNPT